MAVVLAVRPIKSEEDYDRALAEVGTLFEAEPGTPEEDRLEVLGALIEAYEAKHYPILPPEPIDALEDYLESRGLERQDLEPYLGGCSDSALSPAASRLNERMILCDF